MLLRNLSNACDLNILVWHQLPFKHVTKCTGVDSEDQLHNLLFLKYILRHYLMWYSPQFPHASEDTEALGTPAPCQALGKALGIPGGEVPVHLRGPLKSWVDPDQVSPTDRCSGRPAPSKEALKKNCVLLISSLVAKSRFLLQFQCNTHLSTSS